jgi:DNA-binding IclR family transcriptional regulator
VVSETPSHQAVDRALQVLTFLGQHPSGASLQEISSGLGVPKPSLHRILSAMRARGFATQRESGGVYLLGAAALEAAFTFHAGFDLRQVLHPLVVAAHDRFRQTAHLASLSGAEVSYVDKVEANLGVRITSVIGGRNPAHATGLGKALLAHLLPDDEAVRAWVDEHGPLVRRTERTVTTAPALAKALNLVRRNGWAVDDEESEAGLVCVAARVPMVFGDLSPLTAVSVTGLRDPMLALGLDRVGADLLDLINQFDFTGKAART